MSLRLRDVVMKGTDPNLVVGVFAGAGAGREAVCRWEYGALRGAVLRSREETTLTDLEPFLRSQLRPFLLDLGQLAPLSCAVPRDEDLTFRWDRPVSMKHFLRLPFSAGAGLGPHLHPSWELTAVTVSNTGLAVHLKPASCRGAALLTGVYSLDNQPLKILDSYGILPTADEVRPRREK